MTFEPTREEKVRVLALTEYLLTLNKQGIFKDEGASIEKVTEMIVKDLLLIHDFRDYYKSKGKTI